jgi:hypothetical protein
MDVNLMRCARLDAWALHSDPPPGTLHGGKMSFYRTVTVPMAPRWYP